MEIRANERVVIYEPPVLVELGEFIKDTLGGIGQFSDTITYFYSRA